MLVSSPSRTRALLYAALALILILGVRTWHSSSAGLASPLGILQPGAGKQGVLTGVLPVPDAASSDVLDNAPSVPGGDLPAAPKKPGDDDDLPCRNLPGAKDVVVVMRTGATEIQDKLPRHFETTFRCYSDLIIFSDYEETFMGHKVHDVLKDVDETLKNENKDFEIYRRLLAGGRASLHEDELSGKLSYEGSKSGKQTNPGWRLDKWKFLPMMRQTLNLRPRKKWYVFVESDSYLVWSNLLKYLEELDPEEDVYYGSEVQIGDDVFAHGGSAFIMSKSAIQAAAQGYEEDAAEWHSWTNRHWAGDCVLGRLLTRVNIPLGWAWPMFQGGHPEKMDFAEWKGYVRVWCSPILSFHHFTDIELQRIWQFEQDWILAVQSLGEGATMSQGWSFMGGRPRDNSVLHGEDVFKAFVMPNLTDTRLDWNNLSPDLLDGTQGMTLEECKAECLDRPTCLQYSIDLQGCYTGKYAMLGQAWGDGVQSGWLLDRVEKWMDNLGKCKGFLRTWSVT